MVSVEEGDLAGLEDISSDGEDDNYEAELTDNEMPSFGAAAVRKPHRKRTRDPPKEIPLMEGEGKFLRVKGFNHSQRAVFVQILMRFGFGAYDWAEFVPRLKQKTLEEIHEYGELFMQHISEEITDSPTFSDNVPKEGLRIDDVLVRMGTLSLIREKVNDLSDGSISTIFPNDIISRFPGLKGGRFWKEHHDKLLLQAVMKHGYGRWQAIVDDKDLRIQEVICQELHLPFMSTTPSGAPSGTSQPQVHPSGTSQAHSSASGVTQPHGFSQSKNGVNSEHTEVPGIEVKGTTPESKSAADTAHTAADTTARSQLIRDQSTPYHFREMLRRQVEFVKKRVLLLEKGLNAELQKQYYADLETNGIPNDYTGHEATGVETPFREAIDTKKIDELPQVKIISPSEMTAIACDEKEDRLDMAKFFNEMSSVVIDSEPDTSEACYEPASSELRKNLGPLRNIGLDMNKILSPEQTTSSPRDGAEAMDIDGAGN